MEEPQVSIHTPAARSMGGIGRRGQEKYERRGGGVEEEERGRGNETREMGDRRGNGEMDDMDAGESRRESTTATSSSKPEKLSKIQKACLEFCIALFNQSITRKEYDSPLVCALAVLGVKEDGWKGPEQYPPILSAVIKIARFMVVQQALELSESIGRRRVQTSDSAYESDSSSSPPRDGQRDVCSLSRR